MNSDALHWAENAIGASVQSAQMLAGSTSTTLYQVRVADRDYVLRLFDNTDWLAAEPDLARHEAAALGKASEIGLTSPEVVAYDEDGQTCGLPLLLMTFLPGTVELQPADFDDWLRQQAVALARIHAAPVDEFHWRYFPWYDPARFQIPAWSSVPDAWAKAIEIVKGPQPAYRPCFLHRDYHPVNLLWQGGQISGVVDWVNACLGPAGVDVAHCRGNLVAMYGLEAADRFLELYQTLAGDSFTYDPYWELANLVDGLPGPPGVYPPWAEFGLRITSEMMQQRDDAWLTSVLARL